MSDMKLRFLGQLDGSPKAQTITAALRAEAVNEPDEADFVVITPSDLEDMLEDAAATAAFHATREQESLPGEMVDRLLAGESPVKVWREHRGLTQRALAAHTGLNFTYLSQLETGARKGSTQTMKKLAGTLNVDIDDLI